MITRSLRVLEIFIGSSLTLWAFMTSASFGQNVSAKRQPLLSAPSAVTDDYDYYPDFGFYYSSNRRQYVYQQGNLWVARAGMPHVPAEALLNSPSVRLDFHDAPSLPHETINTGTRKNRPRLGSGHAGAPEQTDGWDHDGSPDRVTRSH